MTTAATVASHTTGYRLTDEEAQRHLTTLLHFERNDSIASLASAKAELEVAREELASTIHRRQQQQQADRSSLSPVRTALQSTRAAAGLLVAPSADSPPSANAPAGYGGSTTIEDTIRALLLSARARDSATVTTNTPIIQQTAGDAPRQQPLAATPKPSASLAEPQQTSSMSSTVASEVALHLEMTQQRVDELEQRLQRYETEMQTALTRNEELQLRLDAALIREKSATEKLAAQSEELASTRSLLIERTTALELLSQETSKLATKLTLQVEKDAELERHVQTLDLECRHLSDDSARLRASLETYMRRAEEFETDLNALRSTSSHREEDLRSKIAALSKELAMVREQRDQALRPYHSRRAAAAAPPLSDKPSATSFLFPGVLAASPFLTPTSARATLPQPASSTAVSSSTPPPSSSFQHIHHTSPSHASYLTSYMTSPPQATPTSPVASSSAYAAAHASSLPMQQPSQMGHAMTTAEVMDLKRQVQWLLDRSSVQ